MSRSRIACLAFAAGAILLVGAVRPADAQQRAEPQLLLTIMGGASSGATLYQDIHQPLDLLEDPFATDTLQLGRRLSTAVLLGASATYFPKPNIGLTAEISFIGFGRDDSCTMYYTDPTNARVGWNEQTCNNIAGVGGSASTIAFEVGGIYRAFPRGGVKPYLRGQVGITSRASSTVSLVGSFVDGNNITQNRLIVDDQDPSSLDPTATFGIGVMLPFATGYQARLELRDKLMSVNRITGPADALGQAPTERMLMNSVGLTFMLDIVLEQRRGRRY